MSNAPTRILDAAMRRIASHGVGGASLQEIADEGGVSKALLLYHFGDKAALLVALAGQVGDHLARREEGALLHAEGARAIDAYWTWVAGELEREELRVLAWLASDGSPDVRAAVAAAREARRAITTRTIHRLYRMLGMRPRVADGLLADVALAFLDGLAVDTSATAAEQRMRFDAFWLAMLSLAE